MVTHGGRCPKCESRTTPGIGSRAGLWVCVPCQAVFDNYGQAQEPGDTSSPASPFATLSERRSRFLVVPRSRATGTFDNAR